MDPQLLRQCYGKIHDQLQDICVKNLRQFVVIIIALDVYKEGLKLVKF